ncbi:MAG: hypothetical protein ACOCZ7_02765 [Armatimonadota bacterium]
MKNGCGCNAIAAIIILVVAALIGVGWYQWQMSLREQTELAAAERETLRQQQLASMTDDLDDAERFLQEEEPARVLETLRHMDEKLEIIMSAAGSAGDAEDAIKVRRLRAPVRNAIEAIEGAEDAEEARHAARAQLRDVRRAFENNTSESGNGDADQQ